MSKKLRLNVEYKPEYVIFGVSCHKKDYWIAFHLNNVLNFNFTRIDDFIFNSQKKKEAISFPLFYFEDKEKLNTYYFISNYNPKGKLISAYKQTDYFLFINGLFNTQQKESLIKTIKSIKNVLTVFEINLLSIKNIDDILSDLELHILKLNKKNKL
ncbi:MAG: IPExxxVDY family protein [Bacteroidales bacterium]|nr:IPExxxVDY family protein [Bacteroidales bacterium]